MKLLIYTVLFVILILGTNCFSQLDVNSNYCLRSNNELITKNFVKAFSQVFIEDGDTISVKCVKAKNGLYKSLTYKGESEWNYNFDKKGEKLTESNGFFIENDKKVIEECFCNYDSIGRLKSYIVNQSIKGEENKKYRDDIYYLKGEDSIKYIGSFYSMIIHRRQVGVKSIRTVTDTLGNLQLIEEYVDNLKIFSKTFSDNKESLSTFYIYDDTKRLKTEIHEGWDSYDFMIIIDYINYSYDNEGRLVKIEIFNNDSKLYSIQLNTYNDKGLIEKEEIDYMDDGKYKAYLYNYEYW